MKHIAGIVIALSVAVYWYLFTLPRIDIPPHHLNHTALYIENFIPENDFKALNDIIRDMAEFPSNIDADLKTGGFKAKHEHIGEAQPIQSDGTCSHPYLVPNVDRTLCILPQRVDVGRHFIMTGGPDAIRESFDKMISRVSSFGRYMFDVVDKYPTMARLFAQEPFQKAAKSICPADQQYLDPFQFNFIMQVPGQTVATHVDGVYFWGANRRQFPQWLLACMAFSGLFNEQFIHQVQVVGYLHSWEVVDPAFTGGDFVYYNTNDPEPSVMHPKPRAGALIDGTKILHAAQVYMKSVAAPVLDKNKQNVLKYVGNETWHLVVGDEVTNVYSSDDLRISIVYRARCFSSGEEKDRFYAQTDGSNMTLEFILDKLKSGMSAKFTKQQLDEMSTLDLAFALMDHYIKYPLPAPSSALVPYNYCALPKLLPWTKPIIDIVCH